MSSACPWDNVRPSEPGRVKNKASRVIRVEQILKHVAGHSLKFEFDLKS